MTLYCFSVVDFAVTQRLLPPVRRLLLTSIGFPTVRNLSECRQSHFWSEQNTHLQPLTSQKRFWFQERKTTTTKKKQKVLHSLIWPTGNAKSGCKEKKHPVFYSMLLLCFSLSVLAVCFFVFAFSSSLPSPASFSFSPPSPLSWIFSLPLLHLLSLLSLSQLCRSQITVSVAQGRVRSPSPQPRYKSYAYTQAAYVTSPEQKRRRFTEQVRVSTALTVSANCPPPPPPDPLTNATTVHVSACVFWLPACSFFPLFCLLIKQKRPQHLITTPSIHFRHPLLPELRFMRVGWSLS